MDMDVRSLYRICNPLCVDRVDPSVYHTVRVMCDKPFVRSEIFSYRHLDSIPKESVSYLSHLIFKTIESEFLSFLILLVESNRETKGSEIEISIAWRYHGHGWYIRDSITFDSCFNLILNSLPR